MLYRKLPKAIIFFGPDGSGKSTQADLLVEELNERRIKCKKVWMRSLHTLSFLISNIGMHLLGLNDVYELRSRYAHNHIFRSTWYWVEFLSILLPIMIRFYFPMKRGYTVVAERFVIDWIVSLEWALRDPSLVNGKLASLALHFIPNNALIVYIDASYDAIKSRRPIEDSREFIETQRNSYSYFAEKLHALTIDTSNKATDEVSLLIRNALFRTDLKYQ